MSDKYRICAVASFEIEFEELARLRAALPGTWAYLTTQAMHIGGLPRKGRSCFHYQANTSTNREYLCILQPNFSLQIIDDMQNKISEIFLLKNVLVPIDLREF